MQAAPALPVPAFPAAPFADELAQTPEEWEATIAMTVASTLEPSCAFAFCFGYDFGRRRARADSERSAAAADGLTQEP